MTDSQGGLSLPGTLVPKQAQIRIRRGEGEKLARPSFYHGVYCIINNVVRVESLAHKVVDERAA